MEKSFHLKLDMQKHNYSAIADITDLAASFIATFFNELEKDNNAKHFSIVSDLFN